MRLCTFAPNFIDRPGFVTKSGLLLCAQIKFSPQNVPTRLANTVDGIVK